MQIEVTSDHIDHGKGSHETECPIGLACRDKGLSNFVINRGFMLFYDVKSKQRIEMDDRMLDWIIDFDINRDVDPFTMQLDLTENTVVMLGSN